MPWSVLAENIAGDPSAVNNGTVTYSRDAVGNRLARTSTLAAIQPSTSTYDANDRPASDTYDANGNTKTSNGVTFGYNFENRLTALSGVAATFIYDGDGNRVAKTSGGVTARYLVDEVSPTGYAQVIEEVVGGSVQHTYTFGNSLISQKQLGSNEWTSSTVRMHTGACGC
jgi:hypothetical protein